MVGIQHGQAIFNLSASFHVAEPGVDHQDPMPDAPEPEVLPTFQERMEPHRERMGEWLDRPRPIDTRFVNDPMRLRAAGPRPPRQQVWMRADGPLPDDPLLHACVVAYATDLTLLDTTLLPHNVSWDRGLVMSASLDHAMWFHRPFRADDWLLYDQRSPSASGARGLAYGAIYSRDGSLVVSVVQEGLIRTAPESW